jgi:RNA polymerase sigma factor (TIGR02999 family)
MPMSEVTRILTAVDEGDSAAAERLLPIVYAELRQLAAKLLTREAPGQTLQPTALVHTVFVKLVDVQHAQNWSSQRHFFGAAAECMRRILVDAARKRRAGKRGGDWHRVVLDPDQLPEQMSDLIALDDALSSLQVSHPQKAEIVKLRFFAGLTREETARAMDVSTANGPMQGPG